MSFSLDGKYRSSSPAMGGLRLLPGRRRHIRLERATRYRGCDRALEPVLAHRRYAEDPIVDADPFQRDPTRRFYRGLAATVIRAVGEPTRIQHFPFELPLRSICLPPSDDVIFTEFNDIIMGRSLGHLPTYNCIRAYRPLDLRLGRRRGAGNRRQRGDVQLRHLGEIGEIDMV